jgi:hypothetical protein
MKNNFTKRKNNFFLVSADERKRKERSEVHRAREKCARFKAPVRVAPC